MTHEERINMLQGLSLEAVRIAHLFDKFAGLEDTVAAVRAMGTMLPEAFVPPLPEKEVAEMLKDGEPGSVVLPFNGVSPGEHT